MHAIFEEDEAMTAAEVESHLEIAGHAERVLEDKRLGTRTDTFLCLVEIDVAVHRPTVDVHGSGSCVADRIRDDDVRRHLEEDIVTVSYLQGAKRHVETYARRGEAACVLDADEICERTLVCIDHRTIDEGPAVYEVVCRDRTVTPGGGASEQGYLPTGYGLTPQSALS